MNEDNVEPVAVDRIAINRVFDSVKDAQRASALKTLIANDPDVARVITERDALLVQVSVHRDMVNMLKVAEVATAQKYVQLLDKHVEVQAALIQRNYQINSLGFLFKAFFRRLFGKSN